MTIAVHISSSKHECLSDNFNFVCFSELSAVQSQSHFIFIFDTPPDPELYLGPNCTPVILPPVIKNNLLRHYWYNFKLPAIIQKYNAQIFITSGITCSLKLSIPQCLIIDHRELLMIKKSFYLKRFVMEFFGKASCIFTADQKAFDILQDTYQLTKKSSLLYPGLKYMGGQASYSEREAIQNAFTGGHEYFLYLTSKSDHKKTIRILKAFSIFKKWQKSSMRMVMVVDPSFENSMTKELALYKYRDDLVICNDVADREQLTRAAYAVLLDHPDPFVFALPTMNIGVPVIIGEEHYNEKILHGAIQTSWLEESISEKLIAVYKDEHMRGKAVQDGLQTTSKYSWLHTSGKLWHSFQNLLNS